MMSKTKLAADKVKAMREIRNLRKLVVNVQEKNNSRKLVKARKSATIVTKIIVDVRKSVQDQSHDRGPDQIPEARKIVTAKEVAQGETDAKKSKDIMYETLSVSQEHIKIDTVVIHLAHHVPVLDRGQGVFVVFELNLVLDRFHQEMNDAAFQCHRHPYQQVVYLPGAYHPGVFHRQPVVYHLGDEGIPQGDQGRDHAVDHDRCEDLLFLDDVRAPHCDFDRDLLLLDDRTVDGISD